MLNQHFIQTPAPGDGGLESPVLVTGGGPSDQTPIDLTCFSYPVVYPLDA